MTTLVLWLMLVCGDGTHSQVVQFSYGSLEECEQEGQRLQKEWVTEGPKGIAGYVRDVKIKAICVRGGKYIPLSPQ